MYILVINLDIDIPIETLFFVVLKKIDALHDFDLAGKCSNSRNKIIFNYYGICIPILQLRIKYYF